MRRPLLDRLNKWQNQRYNLQRLRINNEYKLRQEKIQNRKELAESATDNILPYMMPSMYMETDNENEPFGWAKGTVRGIITLWVSMTVCILAVFRLIPTEYFLTIAAAIIMSYFFSRMAMPFRPF